MRLWHELAGDGPPVVLVHEGICDARMWEPQWSSFPPAHRTVRLDLRGFGRSPIPPEPFSHAADVAELLDAPRASGRRRSSGSRSAAWWRSTSPSPGRSSSRRWSWSARRSTSTSWSDEMESFDEAEEAALERGDLDARGRAQPADVGRRAAPRPRRGRPGAARPGRPRCSGGRSSSSWPPGTTAEDELLGPADVGGRLGEVAVPALVIVGELDFDDMHAIAARLEAEIPGADAAPGSMRPRTCRAWSARSEFDRLVLGFLARL